MAHQDIENGAGVCVIDPKGDLVNSLIHYIPELRKDDCIYLSTRSPVPIDFMDYKTDDEKQTLVGELKHVITKGMAAEAAPLMDAILTDLIYTLFSANALADLLHQMDLTNALGRIRAINNWNGRDNDFYFAL